MAQTSVSIRIDEDVKRETETIFAKLGLTLSAATNIFYRQVIRTQSIPFYLSASESKDSGVLLREALKEARVQTIMNGTSEMTLDEISDIISEVRTAKHPENSIVMTKMKNAIQSMREQSVANGNDNMTMDEINAEIAAYRQEKRNNNA